MKPNFKKIIGSDSSRATADLAVEAIADVPEYFKEVLEISLKSKSPDNWRAARVIALSSMEYPELFIPYVNLIAESFPAFKTDGLKRSYGWLLSKYVAHFNEENTTVLIEVCFDYLLKDEKIAVKYGCVLILFELSKLIPELKGELQAAIDFNIAQSIFRMNGVLKKIYKEIDIQIQ